MFALLLLSLFCGITSRSSTCCGLDFSGEDISKFVVLLILIGFGILLENNLVLFLLSWSRTYFSVLFYIFPGGLLASRCPRPVALPLFQLGAYCLALKLKTRLFVIVHCLSGEAGGVAKFLIMESKDWILRAMSLSAV